MQLWYCVFRATLARIFAELISIFKRGHGGGQVFRSVAVKTLRSRLSANRPRVQAVHSLEIVPLFVVANTTSLTHTGQS
jgi:hypothetical protein